MSEGLKLQRTREQWAKCEPKLMAKQSQAAVMYALQDAKRDIDALHRHTDQLRAELAALKAGQGHGEAVAYVKPDSPIKGHTEFCRHETWMIDEGENIMIAGGWFPLYLSAQPASADAVSVPRELARRLTSSDNHVRQTARRELRVLIYSKGVKP